MTPPARPEGRLQRTARLRWVPLAQMRVNPLAQRDLRPARVSRLAAVFDLEQMGAPTVSARGDWYYVIDGQHRVEALKQWLGTWQDQQIQCWTYEGLTEAQEAEVFLKLNDVLAVPAFAKFKVSVQAGRSGEADVDRIVRALRILQHDGRLTQLGEAIASYGRIFKTLHVLTFVDDPAYRRQLKTMRNLQEGRHGLGRHLFHGRKGELHRAYHAGMEDQLGALVCGW